MRRPARLFATPCVAAALLAATTAPGQDAGAQARPDEPEPKAVNREVIIAVPAIRPMPVAPPAGMLPGQGAAGKGQVEAKAAPKEAIRKEAIAVPAVRLMPAMPIVAPAAPPDKAQVEAMAEQFAHQMRPVLRAELHLIRTACRTSEEDQRTLAREGEKALREAATKFAESQFRRQQGLAAPVPGANEAIRSALGTAVRARLAAGQVSRYQEEVAARTRYEKVAAARNLVARLDRRLGLDARQREAIAAALLAAESPGLTMDSFLFNNLEYLPAVPDNLVLPHLDPRQREIFRGIPKVNFGVSAIGLNGIAADQLDLADEDDTSVREEAVRKAKGRPAGPARREVDVLVPPRAQVDR